MKKFYLLLLVSLFTCLQVGAINVTTSLNPVAYNHSAELSQDQETLTVKYCLNADVTSLKIVILNGSAVVYQHICTGDLLKKTSTEDPYLEANAPHVVNIPTATFPSDQPLSWRIELTGQGRANAEVYSLDGKTAYRHKFYRPSSVDIVLDPTSYNYGKVLVVEGNDDARNNSGYHSSPMSKKNGDVDPQGAGIYVFNPDLTPRKNNSETYVFNGNSDTRLKGTVYAPHRVRVSDDGRIFVTSMYYNGDILWEIPPTFGTWKVVMGEGVGNATFDATTYYLNTSGGKFIAAPVAGFDVRGKGSNLQLLMLSCGKQAFANSHQNQFLTYEYNLGTAETWSKVPSKNFYTHSHIFLQPQYSQVQYDADGAIWCSQYYGSYKDTYPALVHIPRSVSATGTNDYKDITSVPIQNAGFRFNNDYTKTIIAKKGTNGAEGHIYKVGKNASGKPTLNGTGEPQIDMSDIGGFVNDFAWDNANNIYAVGQNNASKGGTGYLAMYCLPYSSSDVFTTQGSNEFTVSCNSNRQYNVIMLINDSDMGSVTGGGAYTSCTDVTLTATPNDGYRFVNWTIGGVEVSKNSTYTFTITSNISIQANFAPNVFNVTWHNLFQDYQDITTIGVNTNDDVLNNRLWYLFMPMFNEYCSTSKTDPGTLTQTGDVKKAFHVLKFLDSQQSNTTKIMTNQNSPFYWLGVYIKTTLGTSETIANNTYEWPYILHLFFNRTNQCYSINGDNVTNYSGVLDYFHDKKVPDFRVKGHPDYWRKYWTEYGCGLPSVTTYNTDLPKDWNRINPPKTYVTYKPTWYKWNSDTAKVNQGKLLAWYYDNPAAPTWPARPTLVRNVYQDGALFATWVDKLVSEELTNQNNSDAIWLLNYYGESTHNIKIDRKMQGGMYNTLCLPFSVNESQLAAALPGATVMQFTGVDKDLYDESGDPVAVLNFTQVTSMEAGVPYLVKPAADITSAITFSGITTGYNGENPIVIETAPEQTPISLGDGGSVTFQGTILSTKVYPGQFILVANDRLAQVTQPGDMAGMRGHFIINDPGLQTLAEQGRVYLSMKKPVTTSIPVAPEAEQQRKPEVRKIMRNGQIYIIRDGVTYTITGARVK